MRAALGPYLEAERSAAKTAEAQATVPPDLLEKLGALGYLGAGAPGQGSAPGADPKDKIEEFKVANGLDPRRADQAAREGLRRRAPRASGSCSSGRSRASRSTTTSAGRSWA